jgi:hypothetical protein
MYKCTNIYDIKLFALSKLTSATYSKNLIKVNFLLVIGE